MLGRNFIFTLCILLFGCAQPKYENSAQTNSAQQAETASSGDCSLHFQTSGDCISWQWEKVPTDTELGSLTFKIYRPNILDGSPIELDVNPNPSLLLWMPSMGHGSSPTTVTRIDTGTYRATDVFFIMPGEWQLKFQLKANGTVQDEAILTLTI